MCRLFALIVLCGMCISVFADDDSHYSIFDFEDFDPDDDSADTIIDFSGLDIESVRSGDRTFHYLAGDFNLKEKLDSSMTVHYDITNRKNLDTVAEGNANACDFSADIYKTYLLPIFGDRAGTPDKNICDWEPADFQVHKVESIDDLIFESKLDQGTYAYEITYYKGNTMVGGMTGEFKVISFS